MSLKIREGKRCMEPIFFRLVGRCSVQENGCITWTGYKRAKGYGQIGVGNGLAGNKRMYSTHRVAYECFRGPIPDGLHVLHRCDTPACCNPQHLFLGTNKQNIEDAIRKGRAGRTALGQFAKRAV